MSEGSAPWRALEDHAPGASSPGEEAGRARPAYPIWAVGLGAAALLFGATIVLIVGAGRGSVVVDGASTVRLSADPDAGQPGRSGGGMPGPGSTGSPTGLIIVDVEGAVVRTGIVRLPEGSRVADAVQAAGGFGPRVAVERVGQVLNLAAVLRDGDQVVVPSRDDPIAALASPGPGGVGGSGSSGGSGSGASPGRINLNTASASELDTLPGIGPVTAGKIIAARSEQPFVSLEDLASRKVIGAATLEKIRDLVVVR